MSAIEYRTETQTAAEAAPRTVLIRRLNADDTQEASEVLCQAFENYPIRNYMFEGVEAEAADRFRVMLDYLITARLARGWPVLGCFCEGRLAGAAVISEPGEEWSTPALDAKWEAACEAMGTKAMERFLEYADACEAGTPAGGPYHYLGILGVLPAYQGRGLGRRLVEAAQLEALIHGNSKGILLNTEKESNLSFYRALGFKVVDTRPVGSIRTWSMLWKM